MGGLQWLYGRSLGLVLRHPLLTMFVFLATVLLNIHLYVDDPQGLLPAAGHGPPHGRHPRRPEHLLPGDAPEVPPVRRDRAVRSRDRERRGLHRRRPDEFRLHLRHPEAAQRARCHRRPGDRAAATEAQPGPGRHALHAVGAGHPRRRPPGQCAIPVHPAGRSAARPLHLGPRAHPGAAGRYVGDHRRRFRPAAARPAAQPDHRSRCGEPSRHIDAQHLRDALRRLRPAPGLDHLQCAEPVSRGHGGGAAMVGEPGVAEGHLCQHIRRRVERHAVDRRHRLRDDDLDIDRRGGNGRG